MKSFGSQPFDLECHSASPRPAVRSLQVQLSSGSSSALQLRYVLEAHVSRLRVPSPEAPLRKDELWRHTCFEAFLSTGDSQFYYELNLAPSSQWALYRFDSYRCGMTPAALAHPPEIAVRRSEYRLELDAVLRFDELPELLADATLRVALAAVIEAEDGSLSYWALKHPPGKPDFHHADGFVMPAAALAVDSAPKIE